MIDIPKTIRVVRNPNEESKILQQAKDWLQREERSPGIHASELLDLRRAYFQRVDPKPMDDRSALFFLVGKVLHAFVLGAQDGGKATEALGKTDDGSFVSSELGITYSPDRNRDGVIRELKTSRAPKEPTTVGDLRVYIEQLLIYMAAEDALKAKLDVLYLNLKNDQHKTSPGIRVYDLEVSREGLAEVKAQVKARVELLKEALNKETHKNLPLCREFLCGEAMCPWWKPCKPEGRWGTSGFSIKKPKTTGGGDARLEETPKIAPQPGA